TGREVMNSVNNLPLTHSCDRLKMQKQGLKTTTAQDLFSFFVFQLYLLYAPVKYLIRSTWCSSSSIYMVGSNEWHVVCVFFTAAVIPLLSTRRHPAQVKPVLVPIIQYPREVQVLLDTRNIPTFCCGGA
ncbi:hypothetical protein, partial [Paraglaciecola sp.]|uniref:hypothetical protein n=1 Tax=Paraglaciecola sp. TaxID=1920173 RepID=UPI0032976D6E